MTERKYSVTNLGSRSLSLPNFPKAPNFARKLETKLETISKQKEFEQNYLAQKVGKFAKGLKGILGPVKAEKKESSQEIDF